MKAKEILQDDWDAYTWISVLEIPNAFIRGFKKTKPPQDGYHYIDATTFSDKEQKWTRAIEMD